jgi:hypothetical protein
MSNDYLWDGSGEPDPDVAHLEQMLGELRWSERRGDLSAGRPVVRLHRRIWALAAATIVLGIGITALLRTTRTTHPVPVWQLSSADQRSGGVRAGQVIETGRGAATIESESVGEVNIGPNSRLRLLAMHKDQYRLSLDHGTIHALIWAPPTKFVVDTPAAKTIDLGCQYTLSVATDGKGFLTVQAGWVAFQWNQIESFIPAGAACTTRVGHGPDTPYFLDAPTVLTKALAEFDRTGSPQELNVLLRAARPRDALTLWHLMERTQGEERAEVFERFAGLVALSPGVTREGILRGDQKSMDAAWDALKLGNTGWWREWKRKW